MSAKYPTPSILAEIETYCAARGMSVTAFGSQAMGDPSLVRSLRAGRDPGSRVIAAIRHFMLTGVRSEAVKVRRRSVAA